MSFNPITDLRLNSDDKIEDSPAVNIEVELLPLLRRTASKTKQVANVIKSNNSLLKNDLERITTLRRRLQRVITVIPRMIGNAGSIFGEGLEEPPFGLPLPTPFFGGGTPQRPPVIEEEKVEVPVEQEQKQEQKQEQLDLDISKDKNKVRERIRELIKSGALEEARTLAEEAGITSEFPELVTTDITNQNNKNLYEKLKEIVEQQLEESKVPVRIGFNDNVSIEYDLNELVEEALKHSFGNDLFDPRTLETKEYVMTDNGFGLYNVATPMFMTDKPPSPYLVLMALEMQKEAKESGQLVEMLSESGYKINVYPDGRINIVSPKFRYDKKRAIQNDPKLLTLFYAQAVMDVLPSKVPKGRFFTRANISKNIKLKTYNPPTINVKKYQKRINERVKINTINKFLNRYKKNQTLGQSLLFQADVELANAAEVVMRVMKAGEYIPDKYTKAENRIINEYFTAANEILKMGISQVETMDNMLRFIFPTTSDTQINPMQTPLQLKEGYLKIIETLGIGRQEGLFKKDLFEQLKSDTGSDTLIVLLDSDAAIPTFG